MNLKLENKVALIGGASRGLGRGCALQLAREGANVVICSRKSEPLAETAEYIERHTKSRILAIPADLSKASDIQRVVNETIDSFDKIDILVNNSGGPSPGTFFDFSDDDWKYSFDLVLMYVIRMCRLVIPHMVAQKNGRIINITSLTVKEPSENLILSNVFRVGIISLAKTLSRELIGNNITINNICPGAFKTERVAELIRDQSKKTNKSIEELERLSISNLPLKRYQTPEELGDLVAFLASDLAKGITGTTIQIDGGISRCIF
jgi:3-oxoacyl-[acyl-carrier protein] reductase